MANYLITAPDGKKYRVTGQGSKDDAMKALQDRLGGVQVSPPEPVPEPETAPSPEPQQDNGWGMKDLISFEQKASPFSREAVSGAFQGLDDSARMLANGATLGFADKIAAKGNTMLGLDGNNISDLVTGETPLSRERAKSAAAKERLGPQGDALEMAGSMLPAAKALELGMTATKIPGLAKWAGGIIDGSAFGAAQAAGNDQDIGTGALMGAGAGAAGSTLGNMGEKVLNSRALKAMRDAAPTFEQVKSKKDFLYKALENAGVKFDSISFGQVADDIWSRVSGYGARAPMSSELASSLQQAKGSSPGFRDVEDILSEAKAILREPNANNADKAAAHDIVDQLSTYFDNAPLMTNGSIPADKIAPLAKQARETARRHILARDVKEMERKADWYVSGKESGLRNQAASYGKRAGRGLSDAESKALKKVATREGARDWITKAGSGLSQHILPAVGLSVGGVPGAVAGYGVNLAARKVSERATEKSADKLLKTILAGRAAQKAAKPTAKQIEDLNRAMRLGLLGGTSLALQN